MSAIQELHSGAMYKCGGKVKSWNKRSFILKSDSHLYYYKGISRIPVGNISLHDPKFKVRKGEPTDIVWPKISKSDCRMAVVTTTRTYFMYTNYSHEIEEWLEVLSKAAVEANKDISGGNSTGSSTSVETANDDSDNQNVQSTDILPLNNEECETYFVPESSENPLPTEELSLTDYVDVNCPVASSTLREDPVPTDEQNQAIYDSVSDVITNYAAPLPTHKSTEQEDHLPMPPLPDKEERPPSPDRGVSPPLPDKEESSPLPNREERPPLPDKDEPSPLQEDSPPSPDKEEKPPLPDKEDPLMPDEQQHFHLPESMKLVHDENTQYSSKDDEKTPTSSPQIIKKETHISSPSSSAHGSPRGSGHSTPQEQQSPQTLQKSSLVSSSMDELLETTPPPQKTAEEPIPSVSSESHPVPRPRKNTSPGKLHV